MLKVLNKLIEKDELDHLLKLNNTSWTEDRDQFKKILKELIENIKITPEEILIKATEKKKVESTNISNKNFGNVFIVHGHDQLTNIEVIRLIESLGLKAIVLHEQLNEGKTVIEKFERDASLANYAIAILSPDDIGYPQNKPDEAKPRARQNVILELGYFTGILGRKNICVLYKGDVEIPSDYFGVIYLPFDVGGAWKLKLAKELKNSNLNVDLNAL